MPLKEIYVQNKTKKSHILNGNNKQKNIEKKLHVKAVQTITYLSFCPKYRESFCCDAEAIQI